MAVPPVVPPPRPRSQPPRSGRHSSRRLGSSLGHAVALAILRFAKLFHGRTGALLISAIVVVCVAGVTAGVAEVATPIGLSQLTSATGPATIGTYSHHPVVISLPAQPESYLGLFARGVPNSYAPITAITDSTGVRPSVALYYSGWYEKFQSAFAAQAERNGAVPLIQIDPSGINLTAIVAGVYDTFLETFATEVAGFGAQTGHGVIISFGHEMNGYWYRWGYRHTTPAVFVAAWRHVVSVFRQQGADDVTWLWTANIIDVRGGIPDPAPWWPGDSFVTWVGIDGYYYKPSWTFASLFGPTIKAVRALTRDPILIAETGAAPAAGQPAKIVDLAAGIHAYGLLGFVWFDADGVKSWSLDGPAAVAALRQVAEAYHGPAA